MQGGLHRRIKLFGSNLQMKYSLMYQQQKLIIQSSIFCFIISFQLMAQAPLAEFEIRNKNIGEVKAFSLGDSVFLSYSDKNTDTNTRQKKGFWIDSAGGKYEVAFDQFQSSSLVGITEAPGKIFYYFFNGHQLSIAEQEKNSSQQIRPLKSVIITDLIIDVKVCDNELWVITYDADSISMSVQIYNGVNATYRKITLPFDIKKYLKNASGLFSGDLLRGMNEGYLKMKFYTEGKNVVFTIDFPFVRKKSKTTIVKLDFSTGLTNVYEIPAPDDDKFSSFYHQGLLYRALFSPGISWICSVFDVESGQQVYSKSIGGNKRPVTFGRSPRAKITGTGDGSMILSGGTAEPGLLVEPSETPGQLRMVVGEYIDEEQQIVSPMIGSFPMIVGAFIVARIIENTREGPNTSWYFYLKGNVENGFEFEPGKDHPDPGVRQIIDQYEVKREHEVEKNLDRWSLYLVSRGYIPWKNGALGIYQEKRNRDDKLILLKY